MYDGYVTDVKGIRVGHAEGLKGGNRAYSINSSNYKYL